MRAGGQGNWGGGKRGLLIHIVVDAAHPKGVLDVRFDSRGQFIALA